jgi:hypothetical protein
VTTMVEAWQLLHGGGGINNVPSNKNFVQNSSTRHYRSCPRYVCGDEVGHQESQDCPFLSLALRHRCCTCAQGQSSALAAKELASRAAGGINNVFLQAGDGMEVEAVDLKVSKNDYYYIFIWPL